MIPPIPARQGVDLAALADTLDAAETRLAEIEPGLNPDLAGELRERIATARRNLDRLRRWNDMGEASENSPFWRDLSAIARGRRSTDLETRSSD